MYCCMYWYVSIWNIYSDSSVSIKTFSNMFLLKYAPICFRLNLYRYVFDRIRIDTFLLKYVSIPFYSHRFRYVFTRIGSDTFLFKYVSMHLCRHSIWRFWLKTIVKLLLKYVLIFQICVEVFCLDLHQYVFNKICFDMFWLEFLPIRF